MDPLRQYLRLFCTGLWLWLAFLPRPAHAEDMLLALRLNGEAVSDGEIVSVGDDDKVSITPALAQQLRLHLPADRAAGVSLDQVPGVKTHLDRQALVLEIEADPSLFEVTRLQNFVPDRAADIPDHPGLFMNYNLLAQDTGHMDLSSGLFSLGAFSAFGVATSDVVVGTAQGAVRLRNYVTQEQADNKGSIVAGDGFLPQGAIGEQFPFGGFQVTSRSSATNDPRQIPVETILGQASVPSTVDVFVNDALQSRQSVPTGPFELQNIPVATGDGNVRVVVRDALGQEQVIVRSFYTSPYILPEGSGEYSYEGGMLRRSYGVSSFDYAEPFASGTQRYGWNKWLTTEFHGELSTLRQVIGEQTSLLLAPFGTLRAGGAASTHGATPGLLGLLGAETNTRPLTLGFSGEIASRHFTQLGYTGDRNLQQSMQAQATYDLAKNGTLSASLIHLNLTGQTVSNTGALSYNLNLPRIGFFGASAFSTLGNGATGVILSLSVPLGSAAVASTQLSHDQNGWGQSGQFVQNAPGSGGLGYRALVDHSENLQRGEAGVTYRSATTEARLDAGYLNGLPVERAGVSGSVGLFDGQVFASNETDGNFAVVDTGDVPGVHVLVDQQPVGVTGGDGKLVIPRLRAHEINHIELDPGDIPFDVTMPQPEMEIVPRARTGYVVNFGLKHSRTATASLVREDGSYIAAGDTARNIKDGSSFVVGHDGIVYLTGLSGADRFEVGRDTQVCRIDIVLPETKAMQPDLGKIKCQS